MARTILSGGRVGTIQFLRMPQIAHLKEIGRGGVNPASGNIPAGTRVTFVRKPRAQGR